MGKKSKKSNRTSRSNKVKTATATTTTTTSTTSTRSTSSSSLAKALEHKEEGNAAFSQKQYQQAVQAYQQGLQALKSSLENSPNANNNNNNNKSQSDSDAAQELLQTLYANRAMAYLKLENFDLAEQDCNQYLALDANSCKVWFRRALAREGRAHSLGQNQDWLLAAKRDLQESLHALEREQGAGQQQQANLKRAIVSAEQRIQQSLSQCNRTHSARPQVVMTNGETTLSTTQTAAVPAANRPAPPQQRQDVLRLLQSRTNGLTLNTTANPGNNNNNKTIVSVDGEAFFLIDWQWWCTWCHYVDFFQQQHQDPAVLENDPVASNGHLQTQLLSYLPPGACLPETPMDDDDSSNDSHDDKPTPGPIDNHRLLLPFIEKVTVDTPTRQVFVKHWYQAYRYPVQHAENNNKENVLHNTTTNMITSSAPTALLRPNLVRGYDYEVLPREVYAALRVWYGEVTPSICRRTTKLLPQTTALPLYPGMDTISESPNNTCAACGAPQATSRCRRCLAVRYCTRNCQQCHWPFHKLECKEMTADTIMEGPPPPSIRPGRVGLNNLGNTCFMNSALQSLSHATPLTRHFLSGQFRADLNPSNPLGTGGKLANAYDVVMKDLWMRRGHSSTSPTALKRAIALFAPRFAGCLQHDAQEFLAYLLDGLHEDLNRIRQAPYVEMPDVGQNMAVAGARAWDAHRRRNDSLVLDTFYGQFKSTCVCPKCNRVSVSFDAFNHVSLEIPQTKNAIVPISVLVFPAPAANEPARLPIRVGVEIRRNSPILELRQKLAETSGIAPERLVLCEVYEHTIIEMLKLNRPVTDIRPDDFIVAYDVDPFTNTTFHVLASHRMVNRGDNNAEFTETELFGFPFMTSFSASLTCREIWDHMWRQVLPMVESSDNARSLVRIRLHNGRGKSLLAFPVDSTDETKSEDGAKTAYLPPDLDEKLTTFLGEDATERFLFLSLDWSDAENETDDDTEVVPRLDEEKFVAFENHPSWIEVAQRLKASAGSKSVTLDQCFDAFTKPERLDEHNMWYCSNCREHVQAMKTMELWRLPNVLIVHLKRFEFKHALRRDKLDTLVDFPLEGLDMRRHCELAASDNSFVEDEIPAIYDLFAVTNHYGRMGFGHYTAFARSWDESGLSDDWALFDDSSVRSVGDGKGGGSVDSVVSPAAYVLFYRRRIFN